MICPESNQPKTKEIEVIEYIIEHWDVVVLYSAIILFAWYLGRDLIE